MILLISWFAYSLHGNREELNRSTRRRMPRGLFDFVDRGAEDEHTLRGNAEVLLWEDRPLDEIARHVGVNVSIRLEDLNDYAFRPRGGQVAALRLFGFATKEEFTARRPGAPTSGARPDDPVGRRSAARRPRRRPH